MKRNITIILLSVLILGLGGYLVYDKLFYEPNLVDSINESNDGLENDNVEVEQNYKVDYYMSEDGKYLLILSDFKNRPYSNPKLPVGDSRDFVLSVDHSQSVQQITGSYYLEDGKIYLDDFNNEISHLVNNWENLSQQIILEYTNDKIVLGNIELLKQ